MSKQRLEISYTATTDGKVFDSQTIDIPYNGAKHYEIREVVNKIIKEIVNEDPDA